MIDNNFGEDGINALCDMLKVNTTLSKLNLTGKNKYLIHHFLGNNHGFVYCIIGNGISRERAKELRDAWAQRSDNIWI